jgi:YebC/PmpR family DNA-binding regulatory protein
MSGHNKWSQIKRQKGKTDAEKSKVFSKYARLISVESKRANGDTRSASLLAIIENAKKENVPKDVIERAVKKGTEAGMEQMENITYEAYGPGGCAIIIESLSSNKNKAVQEVKHILSKNGFELASAGSAQWAFVRQGTDWTPNMTTELSDEDLQKLDVLVSELEDNDEVQKVFTNAA